MIMTLLLYFITYLEQEQSRWTRKEPQKQLKKDKFRKGKGPGESQAFSSINKCMKVIFLDFDGVLATNRFKRYAVKRWKKDRSFKSKDEFGFLFDPTCVKSLAQIIKETGANIVVSSSWRRIGLDEIKKLWASRQMPGQVIDITPIYGWNNRSQEINHWLENTDHEITNYLIIDDTPEIFKPTQENLMIVKSHDGLDSQYIIPAITHLNKGH